MGPQVSHIKYCNLYAGTTNVRYIIIYITYVTVHAKMCHKSAKCFPEISTDYALLFPFLYTFVQNVIGIARLRLEI